MFEAVILPPNEVLFAVKAEKSKIPERTDTFPVIEILPVRVAVPNGLLMMRLLKVVAEMLWLPVPFKVRLPLAEK